MRRERPLILAADDEAANLALLRKLLARHGYDVVEATDGPGAVGAVHAHRPDLVLLDVNMPGYDGVEACQRIRAQPEFASLPILLLTALQRPEDKARGLNAGANDFLSKPFEDIELAARIRSLLRTKALQDRLVEILGGYVSESVAEEVLRNPAGVTFGGDRRPVSSLFVDLRGYTSLAANAPPEQTLGLLNEYLTLVSESVLSRGGTVGDIFGDGVFAFFGAPIIHADDPWRAVEAAFEVQAAVAKLEVPEMPGVRLQSGMGITTGEVVAGNIGSKRRMRYTVVGDPVNTASRLQVAAGPGQILIDEGTYRAVADRVLVQDLGTLRLAGKGDWVQAYNVVSLNRAKA